MYENTRAPLKHHNHRWPPCYHCCILETQPLLRGPPLLLRCHPTPISARLISVSCSVVRRYVWNLAPTCTVLPLKVANFILLFLWSGLNYMQQCSTQHEHACHECKVQTEGLQSQIVSPVQSLASVRCVRGGQADGGGRKWLKTRRDLTIDIYPTSPPGSFPDPPRLSTGASSSDCDLELWLQGRCNKDSVAFW